MRKSRVKVGDQILMTDDDGYREGDVYTVNVVADNGLMFYTSGGVIYPNECKLLTSVWEVNDGET